MPGIFGGFHFDASLLKQIADYFKQVWGKCETELLPGGMLGGHAFLGETVLHKRQDEIIFAVDGESSLYENASKSFIDEKSALFQITDAEINLKMTCKGNIAVFDPATMLLYLAVDITGGFPLYYLKMEEGLFFSSLLRPIAEVADRKEDNVGKIEYLLSGVFYAGRTFFKGISRLLPGQLLVYKIRENRLRIYETSQAWVGKNDTEEVNEVIDLLGELLQAAILRCIVPNKSHALLFSGGWDSRLLLGLVSKEFGKGKIDCYSHGDLKSRELRLSRKICNAEQSILHLGALDDKLYDLEFLHEGFNKIESIVFPHFHRAGQILAIKGIDTISCGVFGEVIGGKYGWRMMVGPWGRMLFFVSKLASRTSNRQPHSVQDLTKVKEFLRIKELKKPWYLDTKFWDCISDVKEQINADIEYELNRLERRGVKTEDQLFEAYITEHRATHYTMAQLLSCRRNLNITNIFGDRDLYVFSSRIPMSYKFHNTITREVFSRYFPDLLKFPTAATLISAGRPLILQEGSRVLRRVSEEFLWKMYFNSRGQIGPPHISWPNFEFLRFSQCLMEIIDDIQCDYFDRTALKRIINNARAFKWKKPMHPISDQLLKIYTTDLMMR